LGLGFRLWVLGYVTRTR